MSPVDIVGQIASSTWRWRCCSCAHLRRRLLRRQDDVHQGGGDAHGRVGVPLLLVPALPRRPGRGGWRWPNAACARRGWEGLEVPQFVPARDSDVAEKASALYSVARLANFNNNFFPVFIHTPED
jgi:hypothetical protein